MSRPWLEKMSGARGELACCVCGYVSKICFGYIANLVKILGGGGGGGVRMVLSVMELVQVVGGGGGGGGNCSPCQVPITVT